MDRWTATTTLVSGAKAPPETAKIHQPFPKRFNVLSPRRFCWQFWEGRREKAKVTEARCDSP